MRTPLENALVLAGIEKLSAPNWFSSFGTGALNTAGKALKPIGNIASKGWGAVKNQGVWGNTKRIGSLALNGAMVYGMGQGMGWWGQGHGGGSSGYGPDGNRMEDPDKLKATGTRLGQQTFGQPMNPIQK